MKHGTRINRPHGVTTVDRPASVDDIDLERLVWDPEYRRAVKPLLGPTTTKRAKPRSRAPSSRRKD
jgi:hypothetical protein